MDIPPKAQQEMLIRELESARKHAKNMNERAVQGSLDIGKEKTQFFEKIALASGGTIALVVSFVGAHAGRLQPPWFAAVGSRHLGSFDDRCDLSQLEVPVLPSRQLRRTISRCQNESDKRRAGLCSFRGGHLGR